MDLQSGIMISPFKRAYQVQAKKLVLAGLKEHWVVLDLSKNPDLNDIGTSYINGLFLIALRNNEVVGTGAIVPRPNNTGEIVRMSVATHLRRNGIGKMLLDELCNHARKVGYVKIILETTETWQEVIEFYKNYGFQITHYCDGDVYFSLEI
jgi:ribosomal protein S18 acetylase RimI-like enzyme